MNTRQLNYIVEIAQQQSLTKAAGVLGISQPALSKYLSDLEEELGTPLFFSYKRKQIPTAAGNVYLNAAHKILQIKNLTYQQINTYTNQNIRQFTIGSSGYTGSAKIAKIIPDVHERYPGVNISIKDGRTGEILQLLNKKMINLGMIATEESGRKLDRFFQFSEDELYLVVPSFHKLLLLSREDSLHHIIADLKSLQDIPFIMPSETVAHCSLVQSLFEKAGYSPTVIYTTDNLYVTQALIDAGVGASFVPGHLLAGINPACSRILSLKEHPKLLYGISALRHTNLSEVEKYLIYRLIQYEAEVNPSFFCLNEASRTIKKEFGDY